MKVQIESLGNLKYVGNYFDLRGSSIKDFGNLSYVGGGFDLADTPISVMYTEEEIRDMVLVEGNIYLS